MAEFFTASYKQQLRVSAALITMIAGAAPFVAGLLILQIFSEPLAGMWPLFVTIFCFLLGVLMPWLAQNVMGLAGNSRLRQKLAQKLLAEGVAANGHFVGFAPGAELRVWQGETDRDVGFLFFEDRALAYWGDEYRWELPHEMIDYIDLTPPEAGIQRILVHWHVPREASCTFSLASREARTMAGARRATQELFAQIRQWHKAVSRAASASPSPSFVPRFGLPPTDISGGQRIDKPPAGACLSILSIGIIMLTLIWRVTGDFLMYGRYYEAVLWAGIISVEGTLSVSYLLHYLQTWEAEHSQKARPKR